MDTRKVGIMGNSIYITLPKEFCNKGDVVKIEIVNKKELKIILIE